MGAAAAIVAYRRNSRQAEFWQKACDRYEGRLRVSEEEVVRLREKEKQREREEVLKAMATFSP